MQAVSNGTLPISHGRFLHAAFLDCVRNFDEDLSNLLHDSTVKMFSLGLLNLTKSPKQGNYFISCGDEVHWRIGCIGEGLLKVLNQIYCGYSFTIGKNSFKVMDIDFSSGYARKILTFDEVYEIGKSCAKAERITIEFKTPTTFRYYSYDYPFPKPELVFGSLAEQWNQYSPDKTFNVDKIKQIATEYLIPDNWQGETKRVDFGKNRAITGFVGKFTYRLNLLPEEFRSVFVTLAQFAYFAGIGRLNGQGCGQINILRIK